MLVRRYAAVMETKAVLITGASQGLGAALAREFASRGARLVVTARRREPLDELARELRAYTYVIAEAVDAADDYRMGQVVKRAEREFGGIDVLINNASTLGGSPMPRLDELTTSAFFEVMDVNVRAPIAIAQRVLPRMRARGEGTIVNVSSDAAVNAYAGWGAYGASKAALEHVSRILAAELDGSGVRVIVADPGNMNTQMHRDAEPGEDLSSLPKADEVAPALVDLILAASTQRFARYEVQAIVGATI
ncbi:MAG: SDR family NAD(P)-dependent oxidoreductase [Vulcanimicrobiaceae bacterium]